MPKNSAAADTPRRPARPEAGVDGRFVFGLEGSEDLILAQVPGPVMPIHVAFAADDREVVSRFHAAALTAGGRDNGGPGPRPNDSPGC